MGVEIEVVNVNESDKNICLFGSTKARIVPLYCRLIQSKVQQ